MNGYILIHVTGDGTDLNCYQHIIDGYVVAMVDAAGAPVTLPDPYCSYCITGELLEALPA